MCGIAGFYSQSNSFSKENLIQITSSLAHRGPDAEGYYQDDIVGLGHKRLSIIDLSVAANQPMHSHCNRYVIVYNGEIYNYLEIAKKLSRQWKTHSDTEVILEAFVEWGTEFVNMLNGMFAMAIYDKQEKELFLFRDRIGIKPLFYYWDEQNFIFSSELKAIERFYSNDIKFNLDLIACNHYFHLGYIPEPYTIYKNTFKFPAGCTGHLLRGKLYLKKYWQLEDQIDNNMLKDEHLVLEKIEELIKDSVRYRLISDVPFGIFLSGGIDSTLITAIAQNFSDKPVKTFSIGFYTNGCSTPKKKGTKYNEAPYAKEIANYLKTDHTEFYVSYVDAKEKLGDILDIYDEPFADTSAIPTLIISSLASQSVKMILTGDGGDELFYGYGAYRWAKRLSSPLLNYFSLPLSKILQHLPSRYKRVAKLLDYNNRQYLKSHIYSQEQGFFSRQEIDQLLNPGYLRPLKIKENYSHTVRSLSLLEEQAIFDLKYYLKDDLLVKVDRATMHFGLEARVPFLDHRIVRLALNIDPQLKMKGTLKYLTKRILAKYVPRKYFNRPKWGFDIPLHKWLKQDLHYLIDTNLSKEKINNCQIINYKEVEQYKKKFDNGENYLANRLWNLIVFVNFMNNKKISHESRS